MSSLIAISGKKLKKSSESVYVNVKTNRDITNLNKPGFIYEIYEYEGTTHYLCSEDENTLDEFYRINNRLSSSKKKVEEEVKIVRGITKQKGLTDITKSFDIDIPYGKVEENVKNTKKEDTVQEDAVCRLDNAGTIVSLSNIKDVEDVPDEIISQVCPFNFNGVRGKCKVLRVIDGDTIEVFVGIPFSNLYEGKIMKGKKMHRMISNNVTNDVFFTKLSFRFIGLDTAEKNTIQGQFAKLIMEDYFEHLKNILYFEIEKPDKFSGRWDVLLYSDPGHKFLINDMLIDVRITEIIEIMEDSGLSCEEIKKQYAHDNPGETMTNDDFETIAKSYHGEKKDKKFKYFPVVDSDFVSKTRDYNIINKYKLY